MRVHIAAYTLVVLFGSSSWLGTNSVWMQLPLLTSVLPEGWNLPSYLALVVQIACIGPLIYGVLHKCCFRISSRWLITCALLLAVICQSLMAGLWPVTAVIGEGSYSVCLYAFMFGIALVNATSNVLFMPYMATFHSSLLNAYFVGMGLSSLVPSMLSLVQGTSNYDCVTTGTTEVKPVYRPPRFSVSVYFALIAAWTGLATVAFLVLKRRNWHGIGDEEEGTGKEGKQEHPNESSPLKEATTTTTETEDEARPDAAVTVLEDAPKDTTHSTSGHVFLLLLTALVNAQMNGVIPSVSSYAALPYSRTVYHLALTISHIVSPVASFLPLFCKITSLPLLSALTLLSSLLTAFIIYLGLLSPSLLLGSQTLGGLASVLSVVIVAGLHSFLRTTFASQLRGRGGAHSESWLFWCGVFIQIGSFLGSAVMFPLVNFAGVFKSAPLCQPQ